MFYDLTTTAQVKNWLGQTSSTDDSVIASAVSNFSRYILTRTGRSYLGGFRSYTERYSGNGSFSMRLKNYPVLAVSLLTVGYVTVPQSPDFIQPGWVIDQSGEQSGIVLVGQGTTPQWAGQQTWESGGNYGYRGGVPYLFWEGLMNVGVTYTAGTLVDAVAEAQTVPLSSPYTVTVTNAAAFWADEGVTSTSGAAISGYTASSGVYTFQSAQAGQQVLISYQYGGIPYDLNQLATEMVATNYQRRQWLDQISQVQPGVGTVSFSRMEMRPELEAIISRYTRRFLD